MEPKLQTAIAAARKAGRIITKYYDDRQGIDITEKGLNDFASNVDNLAQDAIVYTLQKAYPDDGIIAEESFVDLKGDNTWIIDPLDGTRNFINGLPHFCISIALHHKNRIVLGLVYDPLKNELFTALDGKGAQLDHKRIRINKEKQLKNALIGTGFPTRHPDILENYLQSFNKMLPKVSDIRRPGAAALELAYVACGRLDGYWEPRLKIWDIAAGMILIKEAGGISSDFNAHDNLLDKNDITKDYDIAAGNLQLYKEIIKTLKQ